MRFEWRQHLNDLDQASTLGYIVWKWDRAKNAFWGLYKNNRLTCANTDWNEGWQNIDRLSPRPDYRAWREISYEAATRAVAHRTTGLGGLPLVPPLWTYRKPALEELIAAVSNDGPLVAWGGLALAAKLLVDRRQWKHFPKAQIDDLAERCGARLSQPITQLPPIADAPIGCRIIRLLTQSALEHFRYDSKTGPVTDPEKLLNKIDAAIRDIDTSWQPGASLTTSAILQEPHVLPYTHGKILVDDCITNVLNQLRIVAHKHCMAQIRQGDKIAQMQHMADRAYQYARSSWLTARSNLLSYKKEAERVYVRGGTTKGRLSDEGIEASRLKTAKALLNHCSAAREAGMYLANGVLCHYLLHTLPDDLSSLDWKWAKCLPDNLSGTIRQLGYEIPHRFRKDPRQENVISRPKESRPMGHDLFACRVREAQVTDSRWLDVLASLQDTVPLDLAPDKLLGAMQGLDEDGKTINNAALRSAFELSVEFGMLKRASGFLWRDFCRLKNGSDAGRLFTKDDLLSFAEAADLAARACPPALIIDVHCDWRSRIKDCWALIPKGELIAEEAFLLQAASLGICSTAVRQAQTRDKLARKYYEMMSADEQMKFLEDRRAYMREHRPPASVAEVAAALRKLHELTGIPTVAASIVALTKTEVSFVLISENGKLTTDRIPLKDTSDEEAPNVLADVAALLSDANSSAGDIPWDDYPTITQLGQALYAAVRQESRDARWLVLAVDPDIASLPWNPLLQRSGRDDGHELLASVVPSLEWVCEVVLPRFIPREVPFLTPSFDFISDDQHLVRGTEAQQQDFRALRDRMLVDAGRMYDAQLSVAFLLGHGAYDSEQKYWTLIAPNRKITVNDWIETLGRYRVVIAHACMCGQVQNRFVGDLSGVPGILLMQTTRVCCSAVTKVSPRTASVLQEHITEKLNQPATVLQRYANAFVKDATVGFYNLYGLPIDRI